MSQVQGSTWVWRRVDELIDASPGLPALRAHRLHLLAGRRWRATGREVPDGLRADERLAAVRDAIVPDLLARVRAATDRPVVLLKGPELARRYPKGLRPFIDLDLLAPDADGLQADLLTAGFEKAEDPAWAFRLDGDANLFLDKHHCHPLRWAGWPLRLEIHRRPSWPAWLPQPPASQLLAIAQPTAADGILALPPAPHALVLAAHLWVSSPFARLRDLLDIALLLQETERAEADNLAEAWGIARLWATTRAVAEALFLGGPRPSAERLWARHLALAREQTVLEAHFARWASPFWALPPRRALAVVAASVRRDLTPAANEPWRAKFRRSARAIAHAGVAKSKHRRELGPEGRQLPRP